MSHSGERVRQLFLRALAVEDAKVRKALLDRDCDGDSALRDRVEALLAAQLHAADSTLYQSVDAPSQTAAAQSGSVDQKGSTAFGGPFAFQPGSILGGYELIELVGQGGMGVVFHGHDVRLGREVAVKMPRLDMITMPSMYQRFLNEATTAAQLEHPGLVSILEIGSDGPFLFIVSQWCRGGDLASWLQSRTGCQAARDVAFLVLKLADAISYCHDKGVLHLDLKPSNILLADEQAAEGELGQLNPKIGDFGIARFLESDGETTLSTLGLGTPHYMSPEQASGDIAAQGPATDVYALGVILYELLYGRRPYEGDSALDILRKVADPMPLKPPRNVRVPAELQAICLQCLEKCPADRYTTADALAEDLKAFVDGRPVSARRNATFRGLWLWLNRPERISQAGVVAIAIQSTVLAMLCAPLLARLFAFRVPPQVDAMTWFEDVLLIMFLVHLPSLVNGCRSVWRRRWSISIGTVLSLVFTVAVTSVLWGAASPLRIYENAPVATFIGHYTLAMLAICQLSFHLAALPAARRLGVD